MAFFFNVVFGDQAQWLSHLPAPTCVSKPYHIPFRPEGIRARERLLKHAAGEATFRPVAVLSRPCLAGLEPDAGWGLVHLLWEILHGAELSNHI